jgi:YidC/Oxa1 family membrane protein insertase
MSALLGVPVDAAYHVVLALTNFLTPVLGGLAAVAGIIVFTAAVRLLVMPLSFRALHGQAAQARLAPQLARLRERYGRQPERLQREMTALYQREGTSVFAGFGPLLAQMPVFSVLYLLFRSPNVAGSPNQLLSRDFLGAPLGGHWLSGAGLLSSRDLVFVGVLVVLTAICWLSIRVARRMQAAIAVTIPSAPAARPGTGKSRQPQAPSLDPNSGVLGVLGKVLPYVTVVIAAFAPLAAALYLIISTGWSAAERWAFTRSRRSSAPPAG